jgi:hypothetical protein
MLATFALHPAGATTAADVAGGVRAQASSGVSPVAYGDDPEPALILELEPAAGLRLSEPDWQLVLRYGPRGFWRTPNLAETARPLWLHRAGVYADTRLSRRWTWEASASGSVGEVDYAAQEQFLRISASRVETESVLTVLGADGSTSLSYQRTSRHTLSFGARASRVGPMPGDDSETYGSSKSVGGFVEQQWLVSSRDSLRLPVGTTRTWLSLAPRYDDVQAQVAWSRRLTELATLDLGAGAALYLQRDEPVVFVPVASVEWERTGRESRGRRLGMRAAASLSGYVDPVIGRVRPIGEVQFAVSRAIDARWSLVANIGGDTVVAAPLSPPQSETYLSTSVALHRIIHRDADVAFGLETSSRASHLSSRPFEVADYQALAFVAFSWVRGTAPDNQWLW